MNDCDESAMANLPTERVINTSKLRNIRTWKRVADKMFGRECMYEDKNACQSLHACIQCWSDYMKKNKGKLK